MKRAATPERRIVPPPSAAELRRARDAAKRPDGTVDPYRFLQEIAVDVDLSTAPASVGEARKARQGTARVSRKKTA